MKYPQRIIDKFLKKFVKTGKDECWLWTASTTGGKRVKYGATWDGERVTTAHRFSYQYHLGEIPEGMCVCHRCDNPLCVNPFHFFLGSHNANNKDMVIKGRAARKLDPDKVKDIRTSALSSRELAKKYAVSQHMIMRVLHRVAWNHVP